MSVEAVESRVEKMSLNDTGSVVFKFQYTFELDGDVFVHANAREIELRGIFQHSNPLPVSVRVEDGGPLVQLAFKITSPQPGARVEYEGRITFGDDKIDPGVAYPVSIRVPEAVVQDGATLRVELLQEGGDGVGQHGGRFDSFIIMRPDELNTGVDDAFDERAAVDLLEPPVRSEDNSLTILQDDILSKSENLDRVSTGDQISLRDRLNSLVRTKLAGGRIRHATTPSDQARFRLMWRFAGHPTSEDNLSITDAIRQTKTAPSNFISDSMVALWLFRADLRRRFNDLDQVECQYSFLFWYLCVRPMYEGIGQSREPTNPVLRTMANLIVMAGPGGECTAIMLAAYYYCIKSANESGAIPQAPELQAGIIAIWFVCEAAHFFGISSLISQRLWNKMASPRMNGLPSVIEIVTSGASNLGEMQVHQKDPIGSKAPTLVTSALGSQSPKVSSLFREFLLASGRARFDDPPEPIIATACSRLAAVIQDRSEFDLTDGDVEYLCAHGTGLRLLVRGEWYRPDQTFIWSRPPVSTLLFCVSGAAAKLVRIGLMFDRSPFTHRILRIFLNHNFVWSGTIEEASSRELILFCTSRCIVKDGVNMLQFEVREAFVPAISMGSADLRRLGIGVKRFWIQKVHGLA